MRKSMFSLVALALLLPLLFFGCGSGDDGATGATGPAGPAGPPGAAATAAAEPESCSICHSSTGDAHQDVYDAYTDTSTLDASIVSVTSVDNGTAGFYDVTMVFNVAQNGQPYIDTGKSSNGNGFPTLNQKTFYAVAYDNATRQFINSKSFDQKTITPTGVAGQYSIIAKGVNFAPELSNAEVYIYVVKGQLETEGMALYTDVYNVGQGFGNVGTYVSAANVSGCEKCHGTPYMKHGYRAAKVAGLPDFAACKVCHYDTRSGGHQSWQLLADNPERYAELHELARIATETGDTAHNSVEKNMTAAEKTQYAYTANVMNDVHMSHAMEFPYPQSMSNCAICHEGKLVDILTDANFKMSVCKSCHPVTGTANSAYVERGRAPALKTILPAAIHGTFNLDTIQCNICHSAGTGMPTFGEIHTGYDKRIYADDAGTRYSDVFKVSIDSASFAGNLLTFAISATESPDVPGLAVDNIVPTVLVGLYGWNTKDYIVGPHENHADGKRNLEAAAGTAHPRLTITSTAAGSWSVTADLSTWADKIANGTVRKVEIAVAPLLRNPALPNPSVTKRDNSLALNAPSRTFDLAANAFVDKYFQGDKAIVKVAAGCNNCHDALGTTFHNGGRGGNIVVCRLCHTTKSGGSHLEMQSRSIDSYVHAIHSFQAFDIGDIDFTDPVETMRYELHVEHTYPNFTIKNCKSCHNAATFNVPDQSKSLPGVLSAADDTTPNGWDRNIAAVDSYVTGPATRACGACHRAKAIKEDNPAELEAIFSHTRTNGYLVDYVDAAGTEAVINTIMANFYDGIVLPQP